MATAKAWRAHPHKQDDLEILFGLSVTDGRTWLAHFSAADRFVAHAVNDMMVIAPTAAAQQEHSKMLHRPTLSSAIRVALGGPPLYAYPIVCQVCEG